MAMAIFASPWAIRWAIDGVLFMARLYLAPLNNIARSALVKLINDAITRFSLLQRNLGHQRPGHAVDGGGANSRSRGGFIRGSAGKTRLAVAEGPRRSARAHRALRTGGVEPAAGSYVRPRASRPSFFPGKRESRAAGMLAFGVRYLPRALDARYWTPVFAG